MKVHWSYPDPSSAPEADRRQAFELTRQAIGYRVLQLLRLEPAQMTDVDLQAALLEISRA